MDKSIIVKNLSKTFVFSRQRAVGFWKKIFHFTDDRAAGFNALDDISFSAKAGEKIGIIGLNGSGKTTLLRLLAGIYRPDSGTIVCRGKVTALIDITCWIKPRLSLEDNIKLGAALFGLDCRAAKSIVEPVLIFAGLDKRRTEPLRRLSAGLIERLVISLMLYLVTSLKTDVLLIDEIFGNSDVTFIKKALAELKLINKNVTIIMTTHDLETISQECEKLIWLQRGKIKKIGPAEDVIKSFYQSLKIED